MVSRVWELWHDTNGAGVGENKDGSGLVRWPTHAMRLHEWGTGVWSIRRKDGHALHDAHLGDDETVAKMGHPHLCCGQVYRRSRLLSVQKHFRRAFRHAEWSRGFLVG